MFLALLEVEKCPAMQKVNEEIEFIQAIISGEFGGNPSIEYIIALDILTQKRTQLRKELFIQHNETAFSKRIL